MIMTKKKKIIKKNLISFMDYYLKKNNVKLSKNEILIPVVNAFIYSINYCLERGIEIEIRGFGKFIIKDIKKDKCIIGGKEYQIKNKKKVIFNWSKKPGIISKRQSNSTDNSNPNTK